MNRWVILVFWNSSDVASSINFSDWLRMPHLPFPYLKLHPSELITLHAGSWRLEWPATSRLGVGVGALKRHQRQSATVPPPARPCHSEGGCSSWHPSGHSDRPRPWYGEYARCFVRLLRWQKNSRRFKEAVDEAMRMWNAWESNLSVRYGSKVCYEEVGKEAMSEVTGQSEWISVRVFFHPVKDEEAVEEYISWLCLGTAISSLSVPHSQQKNLVHVDFSNFIISCTGYLSYRLHAAEEIHGDVTVVW